MPSRRTARPPAEAVAGRRARDPSGHRAVAPAGVAVDVRQAIELVSLVVAPTTLAIALLYWFGFELVDSRSSYFGLGTGTLGFSTTDYLLRGVEAGILPLIVLLLAVVAAVVLHWAVSRVADRFGSTTGFRTSALAALVVSAVITVVATYAAFRPLPAPLDGYLLPPALLATGPLLGAYAVGTLRRGQAPYRPARIAAVAIGGLVVISVFWGASLYADALGRGRAERLGTSLTALPRVTVYSERPLGIDPTVARAGPSAEGVEGRYPYRYSDLRLLLRSDGRFFLLPDGWTPATGTVLVLPDAPDIRVEFSPGGR